MPKRRGDVKEQAITDVIGTYGEAMFRAALLANPGIAESVAEGLVEQTVLDVTRWRRSVRSILPFAPTPLLTVRLYRTLLRSVNAQTQQPHPGQEPHALLTWAQRLQAIPQVQRSCFLLRVCQVSTAEIAQIMEIPRRTAAAYVMEAADALQVAEDTPRPEANTSTRNDMPT